MGRHVDQVPGIGADVAQPVALAQRAFGMRRHLHQVDIEVQQPRVIPGAGDARKSGVEDLDGLGGQRALRHAARFQVPHLPGRAVHDRLGKHRQHVQIFRKSRQHGPHRIGEGVVPRRHVVDRLRTRVAGIERIDQRALQLGCRTRAGLGRLLRVPGLAQRPGAPFAVHHVPGVVVVRPAGIGDAPMGHRAARIVLQRLAETGDGFFVVVAPGPVEAAVEPALRGLRSGGDGTGVGAEVIDVRAHAAMLATGSSGGEPQ